RPTHQIPLELYQNSDQLYPTTTQANVCGVTAPDLIWYLGGDITQQIGIDVMLRGPLAQVRSRANARNPHFAHLALHPLAVDRREIGLEQDRQLPRAVKRVRGVQLVDAALDRHLLRP